MQIPSRPPNEVNVVVQAASDLKGEDIVALDVSERLPLAEAFVIISGVSERHVGGLVDAVEEAMIASKNMRPLRREGRSSGRWVLLNYGDVVVHIQHYDERQYYALDKLWADSPRYSLDISEVESNEKEKAHEQQIQQ